jgi:hypothetical protein
VSGRATVKHKVFTSVVERRKKVFSACESLAKLVKVL